MTRLTNAVRHEYDQKIETLKAELRQNEEILKSDLRSKASQIEALRSGVLAGVVNRDSAVFARRIQAIEQLWDAVIAFGPAKGTSTYMGMVKFEEAAKEAAKNPDFRKIFSLFGNTDMSTLVGNHNKALKTRLFVSPLAWAYYSAYQAIVCHAVVRLFMLKNGIAIAEILDTKKVTDLVKVALPRYVEYIDEHGFAALPQLLEELENRLLTAFQLMLKGEDSDKASLEQAAAIIKKADILMAESKIPDNVK